MNRDDERIIEGMRRQSEIRRGLPAGTRRIGWKSAFGTEGGMSYLGIDQPLTGYLTGATLADPGSTVEVSHWAVPLIEAEVAVRVGTSLEPGVGAEEAAGAIGAVAAAIELIDLGSTESVSEVVAGNIFHRQFLVGEFVDCDPEDLDQVRIAVTANGSVGEPSDPKLVVGDFGPIVAAIADQADLAGDRLEAGDVIITGAAVPPGPVASGDRFLVTLQNGSSVSVRVG